MTEIGQGQDSDASASCEGAIMVVSLNPDEMQHITKHYTGDNDKKAIAKWFAGWRVPDIHKETTGPPQPLQDVEFFGRVFMKMYTVVGFIEFRYKPLDTLDREYWIRDHHRPDEYVAMHVHFEGAWNDDPEERERNSQIVTCVQLRHGVTADQPTTDKWHRKCKDMGQWMVTDKPCVRGLPSRWAWEQTDESCSLAAQAIKQIMDTSKTACSDSTCLTMAPYCFFAGPPRAKSEDKNLALIMAVGDYTHLRKLPNAVRDGETLQMALEKLSAGWEVVMSQNATKQEARRCLLSFIQKCEGVKGAVMITLIGHGAEMYGNSFSYFFLKDSKVPRGCGTDSLNLGAESISTFEICDMLKWPRSRTRYPPTIVVFDCCRTGIRHAAPQSPQRDVDAGQDLTRRGSTVSAEFENLVQIYSTNAGNTACDGSEGHNGPFMTLFHRLIEVPGLEIISLMKMVTKELKGRQLCKCTSHLTGDFYFVQEAAACGSAKLGKQPGKEDKLHVLVSVCMYVYMYICICMYRYSFEFLLHDPVTDE
jgi:hypothetical protein